MWRNVGLALSAWIAAIVSGLCSAYLIITSLMAVIGSLEGSLIDPNWLLVCTFGLVGVALAIVSVILIYAGNGFATSSHGNSP